MTRQIDGLDEGFNALVLIGVNFDRGGNLQIDDAKLTQALSENLDQVRALFVAQGSTSEEGVQFVASTERTRAGEFNVNVTQAAANATLEGTVDLTAGIAADQTVTISASSEDKATTVQLSAGDDIDAIVTKINAQLSSEVAEVRSASLANTTDGVNAITAATTFDQIFGAGALDGDTIRIQGTTHDGAAVSRTFSIDDVTSKTVGDLLDGIRDTFNGRVSAAIDAEGRISVTDNQIGPSGLTVTLVEENEGGGNTNFGSLEESDNGRFPIEITASNRHGQFALEHNSFGARHGFTVTQSVDQLGLSADEVTGTDVAGTINGESAEGFGRILTGTSENENTDGLALRVSLDEEELSSEGNDRGNVSVIYGVGRLLTDTLGFITDNIDGTLKNRERAIDDTIDNLDDQIAAMERRAEQTRLNLVGKFASLEGNLATLQAQGNFLNAQLAGLARQPAR